MTGAPESGGSSSLRAFRTLQQRILAGTYPSGSRLPPERTLAEDIGTSRTSIRQALQALADSDLVAAVRNRGWFVAGAPYREGSNVLRSFTESAREHGLAAGATVIGSELRPATLDEASRLGVAPASPILELTRLRSMSGVPICVATSWIPGAVADGLADVDTTDRSLFDLLEEVCGVTASRCEYEVQAAPADERVARLLKIAEGSPVLIGSEHFYDRDDQPIMLGLSTYRGDAYRFQATLFRS